jgi:hypothetical protein
MRNSIVYPTKLQRIFSFIFHKNLENAGVSYYIKLVRVRVGFKYVLRITISISFYRTQMKFFDCTAVTNSNVGGVGKGLRRKQKL